MSLRKDIGVSSSEQHDPQREAQYARFALSILGALNDAVGRRTAGGETKASLASKIGCNRSQLSRVLNGNVGNITIRTISDILWATRHEPLEFAADSYEDISPNYAPVTPVIEVAGAGKTWIPAVTYHGAARWTAATNSPSTHRLSVTEPA